MIEKEQKAKRVYHRTKPASKSKVRAIRFDLDLVEFINLQPNVSLFINDLIRREKEKIERRCNNFSNTANSIYRHKKLR